MNKNMSYAWKVNGLHPVNAQEAGEEIERIREGSGGYVRSEDIQEASRGEDATLHRCFEWDDKKAAYKYRNTQAAGIVRNLVTVTIGETQLPEPVRAFVSVSDNMYNNICVVLERPDERQAMLERAYAEYDAFKRKWKHLENLSGAFTAFESALRSHDT